VYRRLAEAYGWDANRIRQLTPAQMLIYLGDAPGNGRNGRPGKTATFADPEAAAAYGARVRMNRAASGAATR
jgi:hypothetical protein